MEPDTPSTSTCPSCGALRASRFCPECGERAVGPSDLKLGTFVEEALHFQTHLDNRVVSTVVLLLRRPGELTRAWVEGRRRDYAKPIQLFVVLNLLFFALASKIGILFFTLERWTPGRGLPGVPPETMLAKQVELGYTPEQMVRAVNHALDPQKKWFFLILVPLLTILVWALHPRRKVVEHLVFAIHQASGLFLYMLGLGLVVRLAMGLDLPPAVPQGVAGLTALALWASMAMALKRVFERGWLVSVLEGGLALAALVPAAILSQRLAFVLAVRSL